MEDEKKKLEETEDNFREIEGLGHKLQKQGDYLVKYARLGQDTARHIIDGFSGYHRLGNDYPSFKISLNDLTASMDYSYEETQSIRLGLSQKVAEIDELMTKVSSVSTSYVSGLFNAATAVERIQEEDPETDVYANYNLQKPPLITYGQIESELDRYLNEIDPHLAGRRKGAWETLRSISSDKKAQSAHTIRDILAKLISKWASNDDVKMAEWWDHVPGTKEGVSLKQRLRYLIYGPTGEVKDERELDIIERNVNKCFEDDRYLKETAHGSKRGTIDFLESVIREIEATMLQIITIRTKYHGSLKL